MAFVKLTIFADGTQHDVRFAPGSEIASIKELITDALGQPRGTSFKLYWRGESPHVLVAVNAQLPAGDYDVEVFQPAEGVFGICFHAVLHQLMCAVFELCTCPEIANGLQVAFMITRSLSSPSKRLQGFAHFLRCRAGGRGGWWTSGRR